MELGKNNRLLELQDTMSYDFSMAVRKAIVWKPRSEDPDVRYGIGVVVCQGAGEFEGVCGLKHTFGVCLMFDLYLCIHLELDKSW